MSKREKILTVAVIIFSIFTLLSFLGVSFTWSFFLNPVFGFVVSALIAIYYFFRNMELKEELQFMTGYVSDKDNDYKYLEDKYDKLVAKNEELKELLKQK